MKLTGRQEATLTFIKEFIAKNNYAPTIDEIAKGTGLKARSAAYSLLCKLQAKGQVSWTPGMPRTLRVLEKEAAAQ